MKTTFPWKQTIVLFVAVLLVYLAVFNGIEWARHRKGPWLVEFTATNEGRPFLSISNSHLQVSSRIEFPDGQTTNTGTVVFDKPKKPLPYGKLLYEDLTILPGVVTLDIYGHQIELLPRVLIVNKRELPWRDARLVQLWATNKPAVPLKPAKGYD